MKEHVTEKYKESIARKIKENIDNGGKICELKRKLEKKVQTPYSITYNKGIELENRPDIYKRGIHKIL